MNGKTAALIFFLSVPFLIASPVEAVQNKPCIERFKELDDLPTEQQKDSDWAEVMSACRAESEAGSPEAMNAVGDMLSYGTPKASQEDDEQAFLLYEQAAKLGFAEAKWNLGLMYKSGEGVPKNINKALFWLRESAAEGFAKAQFSLGMIYLEGQEIPQVDSEAMRWITAAADSGYYVARRRLAKIYHEGLSTAEDHRAEMALHKKGAEAGDFEAQYALGWGYANGHGVPQNNLLAYMWVNVSGRPWTSRKQLNDLKNFISQNLTSEELQKAQNLSTECFVAEYKNCEKFLEHDNDIVR